MRRVLHRVCHVVACVGMVSSCSGGTPTSTPGDVRFRFAVTNDLIAPVTVAVDDTPVVILAGGAASPVAVRQSARQLSWISAKTTDASGRPIPDDLDTVRMSVGTIQRSLEITNVVNGEAYFTGRFFNHTSEPVGLGVYDGTRVACAGVLPGASDGSSGFVLIGYFRLRAATEVRAYRDTGCTGPYAAWPRSALAAAPKSGSVTLTLDVAP